MKKSMVVILMVGLFALCAQATPTLTLIPSNGGVSGLPGDTVGWGFTVTNDSTTEWLSLSGSVFNQTGGLPFQGTYVDYISNPMAPFVVVGPSPESSSVMETFGSVLLTGTGEFDIASTANSGPIIGNIVVSYDVFSQDPNDPSFDPGSYLFSGMLTADASVNVPEPASAMMLLAGTPLLLGSLRRKLCR